VHVFPHAKIRPAFGMGRSTMSHWQVLGLSLLCIGWGAMLAVKINVSEWWWLITACIGGVLLSFAYPFRPSWFFPDDERTERWTSVRRMERDDE